MTLQNLAKIGQLKPHVAPPEEIQRILAAIDRNLVDAAVAGIHDETRFDCAYKAIMQCALVAMLANGYRPSTNAPGHHQTMIQSLPLTLGFSADAALVLDALRRKRNAADYAGGIIESGAAEECVAQARALRERVKAWLRAQRPDLLKR